MSKILDILLGLIIGLDPNEMNFKRNIRRLKKEKWFREIADDARNFETIYQNSSIRNYLNTEGIVDKILHHPEEKELFLSKLTKVKKGK